MKKPVLKMLKKGSKLKRGDIVIREDLVKFIEEAAGEFVHGRNNIYCTEGYYFRITWKEDKKCSTRSK